jgi:hypothetical protein
MNWKELETYANDLAIAAKSLADRCQDAAGASSSATPSGSTSPGPAIPPSAANQIRRAKRNVLAKMAQLQTLLSEPTDVIQHLAVQVSRLVHGRPSPRSLFSTSLRSADTHGSRINFFLVYDGWASSRCWHTFR